MITAAVRRIPYSWHFHWIYVCLAAAAFVGGAFLTLDFKTVTITRMVHVGQTLSNASPQSIEAAWGHPDQSVPLSQLNPALTCDVYQSRKVALCHP